MGHYGLPEKINAKDFQEPPPKENILKGAEPIFLEGKSKTAFLMIHGFEDSPFSLRPLAEIMHNLGHTVIAPLLPGHGTSIKDFRKTRYEHWYEAVRSIYKSKRDLYDKFFIVGFSMGGNLSLKLAAEFSDKKSPSGMILISTPAFLNGFADGRLIIKNPFLILSGIIKYILPYIPKKSDQLGQGLISPWVGYYEATTTACAHSFKINIGKVRKEMKKIKCPLFLVHATNDKTIPAVNLHYILRKVSSKEKRAFMFEIDEDISTRHALITHEQIRDKVYNYIIKFVEDTMVNFDLRLRLSKK
ncbi:MAG: alpha/beta fold hydrolase [Spirochaetia bacterium]|nr:alpha/beta fold hydrolase [Spirochaetia bacterium]